MKAPEKKQNSFVEGFKSIFGVQAIVAWAVFIKDMGKIAFIPKKSNRVETFRQAVARHGQNEDGIRAVYRNYMINFYSMMTGFMFCLGLAISYFNQNEYLALMSSISISTIFMAGMFSYSFRCFQIRIQELCSPKKWFNNKQEWLPTPLSHEEYVLAFVKSAQPVDSTSYKVIEGIIEKQKQLPYER